MPSEIKIDGAGSPILEFHFVGDDTFSRKTDVNGRPSSPVSPARIQVKRQIRYSPKDVISWFHGKTGKSVTIELKEDINQDGSTFLTISLSNTFVVKYRISYIEDDSNSAIEIFELSAEKLSIEGVEFEWKFA